jgi:hypothetical protein
MDTTEKGTLNPSEGMRTAAHGRSSYGASAYGDRQSFGCRASDGGPRRLRSAPTVDRIGSGYRPPRHSARKASVNGCADPGDGAVSRLRARQPLASLGIATAAGFMSRLLSRNSLAVEEWKH